MLALFNYINMLSCLIAALFVIFSTNPIHAVFFLITVFIFSCTFLFLHGIYFFACVLLIIYVGAVAVLFLFVVMMLDTKKVMLTIPKNLTFQTITLTLFFLFSFSLQLIFILKTYAMQQNTGLTFSFIAEIFNLSNFLTYLSNNLQATAFLLYTYFWFLFLIIGLILFLVVFLVINITRPKASIYKRQISYLQIYKNYENTVYIIKNKKA